MSAKSPTAHHWVPGRTALALSIGIALTLMMNEAAHLFRLPYYEMSDIAANSLAVRDAREWRELYGPYSRWGFYHPGPGLFYLYAIGEKLFCDWLHLVPAPGNAQLLTTLLLNSVLLGASLAAIAHVLRAPAFLPLALSLGVMHFGSAGAWVFLSPWSAHILVVLFVALLAASSCVAAGRGEQLPLLIFAGGLLVHLHVAQPLFVVPLALLAYAAWIRSLSKGGERVWPWRFFPRSHVVAATVLALFLLPMLIDACFGAQSNLAKILKQATHAGDHHTPRESFLYFVHYGAYLKFEPGAQLLGQFSPAAMRAFLASHALLYGAWLLAFAVPVGISVRIWRRARRTKVLPETGRLVVSATGILVTATALTLVWGMVQDGELFYHNAFFNYAIYYFAALLCAALFALWLDRWRSRYGQAALWLVALALVWWQAPTLRGFDPGRAEAMSLRENLVRVLSTDAAPGTPKILLFEQVAWPVALGVVLHLERLDVPAFVENRWAVMFGGNRTLGSLAQPLAAAESERWRLVPADSAPPGAHALGFGYSLDRELPPPTRASPGP